jgi:thioesterase domain-containing protein
VRYVADIRRVQQQGPYRVAGWCAAGSLAVEIARQLILQGEEVAWLTLFDSWLPGYAESLQSIGVSRSYARVLAGKLAHHKSKLHGLTLAEGMKYLWGAYSRMGREARDRFYIKHSSQMSKLSKLLNLPLPQFMHNSTFEMFATIREYRAESLPVRLTLIRATDSRQVVGASVASGWETVAEMGVDVLWAPGDHETMFRGSNLKITAKLVRDSLETTHPSDSMNTSVQTSDLDQAIEV